MLLTKVDLSVEIAGLKLRSPIILSSSPVTMDGATIVRNAKYGAGAAVTKTILPEKYINYRPCMAKLGKGMINCEEWSETVVDGILAKDIWI